MKPDEYANFEAEFESLIRAHLTQMDNQSANHVRHYVDAGELEMAFESFVLSSMDIAVRFSAEEKARLHALGLSLGLQSNSVFRADFWARAAVYLSSSAAV
jgi:hypothetical protein